MSAAEQLRFTAAPPASAAISVWRGDPLRRRLLALSDALTGVAFVVAMALTAGSRVHSPLLLLAAVPIWLVVAKLHGLYDRDHSTLRHLTADELPSLLLWVGTSSALTLLVIPGYSGSVVSMSVLRVVAITFALAVLLRVSARILWRTIVPAARVVIVGEGALAQTTRRKLELFRDIHATVVAELPLDRAEAAIRQGMPLADGGCDRVILASSAPGESLISELLQFCRASSIKLSLVPPTRGRLGSVVHLTHVAELPVLEYNTWDSSRSTMMLKRLLDIFVATVVLAVLFPLLLVTAFAVYAYDRGPILFRQRRAGLRGEPFTMWKFRTMVVDAEEQLLQLVQFDELEQPMFKFRRDPRVTPVGRIVRRLSIDELPQLLNVLRGDMSLVGPRPEQVELVDRYTPEQRHRLSVKPGLTGPMQVYGRGELSFEERLAVEREYIENVSLGRDVRILALTLAPVLTGRGAY